MYTLSHTSRRQVNIKYLLNSMNHGGEINNAARDFLTQDAQKHIDQVAQTVSQLLEKPNAQEAFRDSFGEMLRSAIFVSPNKAEQLQNALIAQHDIRMQGLNGSEAIASIERFSTFMSALSKQMAYAAGDVVWDTGLNHLKMNFSQKYGSIIGTYHSIQTTLQQEVTNQA